MPERKEIKKSSSVKNGLYKRGENWYVRCQVDGILIRRSIGPNKAKAQAVLLEIKSQRALKRATGEMSGLEELFKKRVQKRFSEVAESYIEERPHLKASSKRSYKDILDNYLIPSFGKLYLDEITEEQIARFQAHLAAKVSAKRTNNIMGLLRFILKVSHRRNYLPANPALNVPSLREEAPNVDPLNLEELGRAIDALKVYQRPLFVCLAWTGARPDELFALRWDDVNFEKRQLTINKGRVFGQESSTKTTASNRTIHMFSPVLEALIALKAAPTQHLEGYVFLNKRGQPFDKHVDREWRAALAKAKIKHRPAYQLRHTFASMCLQQGATPSWVARMLGHTTPAITFKHYARFIDDKSGRNESLVEQHINEHQNPTVHSFVHSKN